MADQPIKVIPPALLEASTQAAMHAETAATVHPGVVPVASPGSPADAAAATIAAGMSARSAELSAKLAGKGPQVQALTQSGVTQLQGQDEANAAALRQLAQPLPKSSLPFAEAPATNFQADANTQLTSFTPRLMRLWFGATRRLAAGFCVLASTRMVESRSTNHRKTYPASHHKFSFRKAQKPNSVGPAS
jgi:hypothetical protein